MSVIESAASEARPGQGQAAGGQDASDKRRKRFRVVVGLWDRVTGARHDERQQGQERCSREIASMNICSARNGTQESSGEVQRIEMRRQLGIRGGGGGGGQDGGVMRAAGRGRCCAADACKVVRGPWGPTGGGGDSQRGRAGPPWMG